jgi:hypothetical protein
VRSLAGEKDVVVGGSKAPAYNSGFFSPNEGYCSKLVHVKFGDLDLGIIPRRKVHARY